LIEIARRQGATTRRGLDAINRLRERGVEPPAYEPLPLEVQEELEAGEEAHVPAAVAPRQPPLESPSVESRPQDIADIVRRYEEEMAAMRKMAAELKKSKEHKRSLTLAVVTSLRTEGGTLIQSSSTVRSMKGSSSWFIKQRE